MGGIEPVITIYSDGIEILSRGGLAPLKTKTGFLRLLRPSERQIHVDRKTGRGILVVSVSSKYGEKAFDFSDNDITVTVLFNFINEAGNKVGNKTEEQG